MIKFATISENATPPHKATPNDSGYDLYATEDTYMGPGDIVKIHTGIVVAIPIGYGGFILPRSGLAINKGITVANAPGLIDSDYRGEVIVGLINHTQDSYIVKSGDRVAQLVVIGTAIGNLIPDQNIVNENTTRKDGGLGSTGE